MKSIMNIVLYLGLFLLLLEAVFIFRPMVKQVVHTMTDLEKSNAELIEFSYRISHDLRSPIVSSLGLLDVVEKGVDSGNKSLSMGALGHIKASMTRLESLIDDIINLTKMKLADYPNEAVDFSKLLEDVIGHLHVSKGSDKIKIIVDNQVHSSFKSKPVYLRQTLENLLSNAIKYHDAKKPSPFIKITSRLSGLTCIVEIIDNGVGIPEEYRSEVFGMFKRFHPKQSFGSGLGLYLVSQNVEILGGKIDYEALNDGTKFTFSFPITREANA